MGPIFQQPLSQGGTSAERSWYERFLLSYEISCEKFSKTFSKCFKPSFKFILSVQKHSANFLQNYPQDFPAKSWGKFTDELLQARRENIFLAGNCPNLGRHSISCCRKIGESFSSSVKVCRETLAARNFGQPQPSRVFWCV